MKFYKFLSVFAVAALLSLQSCGPNPEKSRLYLDKGIDYLYHSQFEESIVSLDKAIEYDWTGSLSTGSVQILEFGNGVSEAAKQAVATAEAALKNGTLNVFDTTTFTVNGKHLTSYMADVDTDADYAKDTEVISNGVFMESKFRSAPYFDIRIDGITELN